MSDSGNGNGGRTGAQSFEIKVGLAEMMKGGVIMDVTDPEQAKIDWEDMRRRQEEPARKTVHAQLVLDALAKTESIAVDGKEVDDRIGREAARVGEDAKKLRARLRKQGGIEALKTQMLREKSLDYATSVANIQNEE